MSTVCSQRKLKKIDRKSKLIIYGFIREIQTLLSQNKLLYNIPLAIGNIILLFYFEMDEFDLFADGLQLSTDRRTVGVAKRIHEHWAGAYGTTGINSENNIRCYWKIKIMKEKGNMFIGVVTNRDIQEPYQYKFYGNAFYTFFNHGDCHGHGQVRDHLENEILYGKSYGQDDVVGMYLDLIQKEIHFGVNDKEYDIAFKNITCGSDIVYYLGISVHAIGNEMRIIDFGYY